MDWLWSLPLIAILRNDPCRGSYGDLSGGVNTMRNAVVRRRFVPVFIAVIGRAALLRRRFTALKAACGQLHIEVLKRCRIADRRCFIRSVR